MRLIRKRETEVTQLFISTLNARIDYIRFVFFFFVAFLRDLSIQRFISGRTPPPPPMMETRNHFSTSHRFYVCLHRSHRKSARTSKFFKYLVILCNVRRGTPLHHQRHPTTTTTQSKRMINEKRNVSVCAPIFRSLADFFVCYV